MTSSALAADLHRYWSKAFMAPGAHQVSPIPHSEPAVVSLTHIQGSIALAELLSATPSTHLKAEHLLESLKAESAADPGLAEQLAVVGGTNAQTADERAAMTPNLPH